MAHQPAWAIVTGASRGFGRALAVAFSERHAASASAIDLRMVLVARSRSGLEKTAKEVSEHLTIPPILVEADFCDVDGVQAAFERLSRERASEIDPREGIGQGFGEYFDRGGAVLFDNAGGMGPLGTVSRFGTRSAKELQDHFNLNVTSSAWLAGWFLRTFGASSTVDALTLVNISSLAAEQPFPTWGAYCSAKASRDMLYRVIAEEHKGDSGVRTLSYAPGPLDTAMFEEWAASEHVDASMRASVSHDRATIDPLVSARRCVDILSSGAFVSGAHVDFYDQ